MAIHSQFFVISLFIAEIFACFFIGPSVDAAPGTDNNLGVGIMLGEPTGFSGKVWTNRSNAVDFGLAFSFNNYVLIFSDYLWHFPGAFGKSSTFVSRLNPYIGVGGMLAFSDGNGDHRFFTNQGSFTALGIRVPFGIEWIAKKPSFGVFVELVPGMFFVPGTEGFVGGDIGIRYYF